MKKHSIFDEQDIIAINREFSDGTVRDMGMLSHIVHKRARMFAKAVMVAKHHPFLDGNKRTAIKIMEIHTGKKVPNWIYKILENV